MILFPTRRFARIARLLVLVGASGWATGAGTRADAATHAVDPAQLVPLDQLAPQHRDHVAEVIREHTIHHQGPPETFACHPQIYLSLLNEPVLTLALWNDLSATPATLRKVGPNVYQGTDGKGATATWEFVFRSPRFHVLLVHLEYISPRGNIHLNGRLVLLVRTLFFQARGQTMIQHAIEAFLKIDTKGFRSVARAARPILERITQDQIEEAGLFVSLMGRLVEMYPNWACQVAQAQGGLPPETRQGFRTLVLQNRKPGASSGRPQIREANAAEPPPRR